MPREWRKIAGDITRTDAAQIYASATTPVIMAEIGIGVYFRMDDKLFRAVDGDTIILVAQKSGYSDRGGYHMELVDPLGRNDWPPFDDLRSVYIMAESLDVADLRSARIYERVWHEWNETVGKQSILKTGPLTKTFFERIRNVDAHARVRAENLMVELTNLSKRKSPEIRDGHLERKLAERTSELATATAELESLRTLFGS